MNVINTFVSRVVSRTRENRGATIAIGLPIAFLSAWALGLSAEAYIERPGDAQDACRAIPGCVGIEISRVLRRDSGSPAWSARISGSKVDKSIADTEIRKRYGPSAIVSMEETK